LRCWPSACRATPPCTPRASSRSAAEVDAHGERGETILGGTRRQHDEASERRPSGNRRGGRDRGSGRDRPGPGQARLHAAARAQGPADGSPGRQPDQRREDQAGRAAVLRQALVEDQEDVVRDLPRSREGVDRRAGAVAEVRRQHEHAPHADPVRSRFLSRSLLGRPGQGAGGADPRRVARPDGRGPRRDREGAHRHRGLQGPRSRRSWAAHPPATAS
jgi:hypothetical protein